MKEWSVLVILICTEDKRSSADTKRQVLAVDEARPASLIAYSHIGCPGELKLIVFLSVIVSVNTAGSLNPLGVCI